MPKVRKERPLYSEEEMAKSEYEEGVAVRASQIGTDLQARLSKPRVLQSSLRKLVENPALQSVSFIT